MPWEPPQPRAGAAGPGSWALTLRPPAQSSLALPNGERARAISEYLSSSKKRKVEEKDFVTDYVSPGLGGLGHPRPLLRGEERSCPRLWQERGWPQSLWLQPASAFQGSDADKSEDNLVVDEVSVQGAGKGLGPGRTARAGG